jgi:NTE family protein
VRGLAHIGVLKVLERERIEVSAISGASMGGLIGAVFATGFPAAEIERLALELTQPRRLVRLMDLSPTRRGFIETHKVRELFREIFNVCASFDDLEIPLALTAVDIRRGQEVVMSEGSVVEAVLATTAVPGVFPPVVWRDRELVDGGVLNNLPADVARSMGVDVVLAVDVAPIFGEPGEGEQHREYWPRIFPPFGRDLYTAEMIMTSALTYQRLQASPPDVLLHPCIPPSVSIFWGFTHAQEVVDCGERAAKVALPLIRSHLETHTS